MDQQQQNQRFWSGPRLGLINHSAWACSHHDCATYIPQEVGRWALQETLLQGPGEVTLRLNWSHQAVCEPHHRKNSCVWYWVCKFRIFKSHQSLDLKIVMEWKSNKHPGFFNLKLVTSSDPCFTAGLVDHGCDLHRSIQRNLGGRWLHVTWRKWSYSQWFFLHDFKGVHMTVVNKFNLNPRPRDLDGSTWLLSKPFRTRPTDYIQGFSYIYIYIESDFNEYTSNRGTVILHLVQGATIKKVAPYNWHHANWDPMKQFIKAEIESGRFIPNFPLDF